MKDLYLSLAVGASLVVLGVWLWRWHWRGWLLQRDDPHLDDRGRRHYRIQLRRRVQVSLLLVVLGVTLPTGDALMTWGRLSQRASILWIVGMLVLALWIMLLAALDWLSTRIHLRQTRNALAGLARKRRELEEEVARLRQQGRNGRG